MPLIAIVVILLFVHPWSDEKPAEPRAGTDGTLFSDTGEADPEPLWGSIDCVEPTRVSGEGFRRFTIIDGDDFEGERCELGENQRDGPTALFHEGERRITSLSVRLPDTLPLDGDHFQVVMQMKQAQPSDNGVGTPVLALEAWDHRWRLRQSDATGFSSDARELWSTPAEARVWTRFALDVTYSQDPDQGSVMVSADLDHDGDFSGAGERSEALRTYTLKTETADGDDGLLAGEPVPSHLRIGLYHDPTYECPPPSGCQVEVDDVQVVQP